MAKHSVAGVKIPSPTKLKGGGKSPITPTYPGSGGGPDAGSLKKSDSYGGKK